jgi:L-ascorbate metabolism protein UlaG (beta-lactamase superfamily)
MTQDTMNRPTLADLSDAEQRQRIASSPQRRGGKFVNSIPTSMVGSGELMSIAGDYFRTSARTKRPQSPVPSDKVDLPALASMSDGIRVTWLGHSTNLLEVDGARFLTDPVWGKRASPFSFSGPLRFHDPLLPLDALPRIDAILLSHDHYDHLCMETMRVLATTDIPIITTLAVGARLLAAGFSPERITELDWWETLDFPTSRVQLTCTPARHFSGRSLTDRFSTLWCSWAIVGPKTRLYFSADSGPSPDFDVIGERFDGFDLAMFEIGAYHPSWGNVHLGPDGAIEANRQVRAKVMMPIHWGTFDLGLHAWNQPIETLYTIAEDAGMKLLTPRLGQSVSPQTDTEPWWTELTGAPPGGAA